MDAMPICEPVPSEAEVRTALTDLLDRRAPQATVCPSEVARALLPQAWRPLMPLVRAVAVAMAREGRLEIRQRGHAVPLGVPLLGPIRLGRSAGHATSQAGSPDGEA